MAAETIPLVAVFHDDLSDVEAGVGQLREEHGMALAKTRVGLGQNERQSGMRTVQMRHCRGTYLSARSGVKSNLSSKRELAGVQQHAKDPRKITASAVSIPLAFCR